MGIKFVAEMTTAEKEIATFGEGFKRDANGKPIEQGRGAPGNPHLDSHQWSEKHKLREMQNGPIGPLLAEAVKSK